VACIRIGRIKLIARLLSNDAADVVSANSIANPLIVGSFPDQRPAYPQADPQMCILLLATHA